MNTPKQRGKHLPLTLFLVAGVCTSCVELTNREFRADVAEIFGSAPKTVVATQRISQPPSGKALVNFHFPLNSFDAAEGSLFGDRTNTDIITGNLLIFDGSGQLLMCLSQDCIFQHICDPGDQLFIAGLNIGAFGGVAVKADLLPDETYDILTDVKMGLISGNPSLIPLAKNDPRRKKLAKFEARELFAAALNPASPRIAKIEARMADQIEQIRNKALRSAQSKRILYLHPDDHR